MILLRALLLTVFALPVFAGPPQSICLRADQSFRGPFTHEEPIAAGESRVTISVEQYAALNALRTASPNVPLIFNGATFLAHPLRAALIAEFAALSPGEKLLFEPEFRACAKLLDAGLVSEARRVIFLSGANMPEPIWTVRQNMLAIIDAAFP